MTDVPAPQEQPPADRTQELLHELAATRNELVTAHNELRTLHEATETRQLIGQATGLLAAQLDLSTQLAWQTLRQISNLTNYKIRDIAVAITAAHDGTLRQKDDHTITLAQRIAAILPAAISRARQNDTVPPPPPHELKAAANETATTDPASTPRTDAHTANPSDDC